VWASGAIRARINAATVDTGLARISTTNIEETAVEPILSSIIAALAAGAVAKASDIGGKAISDAYDGLKSLIIRKLGKGGAVQSVEDEPSSASAQATLAEAMAKGGVGNDADLASKAKELEEKLAAATATGASADIDVGNIRGKINAIVEDLVATGRIKLGDVVAESGDARLTGLRAGFSAPGKS
jgi:hypothetical protein